VILLAVLVKLRFRRALLAALALCVLTVASLLVSSCATVSSLRAEARALAAGAGVTPSQLPSRWIEWLLLVEDPAFRSHHGIDLATPGAGWTTLTQGLVKLHFAGPSSGPIGKPLQSARALVLDAALTKDEQLTLVLNTAYFGTSPEGPVLGFPRAAEALYGRRLLALGDTDFLGLVAMLIGPNQFHPLRAPRAHEVRLSRIRALVAGRCAPSAWRDVYLSGCSRHDR
jgi:membrane peptidoglycan carboxypeptidase